MKNRIWNHRAALGVTLAGMCLLLNACAGLVKSTGGGGGGGGTPAVSMSSGSLTFASQTVNTTSAAQSVTLTNTGSAVLTLTSITITGTNSGDFSATNTCGGSINANANCIISVTFTPTAAGTRTASVSITDNATGSPQTVSVTGTGASSTTIANVTPTSLAFGTVTVNTTSAPQTVTVTNGGTTTFTVNTVTTAAPFAVSGFSPALPATLTANQTLTFQVTFAPTAAVASNGSVTITYSAGLSNGTVSLSGTGATVVTGPASAPAIFFTDLVSGPNTGGENGNGTILTIYGARFGATQGASTVTVGGGLVADYKLWSDSKISVALGAAALTGNVVVTTANGPSNGTAFTVRAGNIFCVSTSGNDSNTGAFPLNCWATIVHAKNTIAAGDIAYIQDGVTATAVDNFGAALSIETTGTVGMPKALVAYPSATVTVGVDSGSPAIGIRVPNTSVTADYWVIAGLHLHGTTSAFGLGGNSGTTGWRAIGNDMTCPNGDGAGACAGGASIKSLQFYGNRIHDVSVNVNASKLFHAVYWGHESDHVDFGWNEVGPSQACRGVQFHSTAGNNQFDLHVHDNYIHDTRCDGINFATVDPSLGPVEAYNNVLVNTGAGPDPPDGTSDYAGVFVPNTTNAGSPCATNCVIKVYNNTIYDAGARQSFGQGAIVGIAGPNSVLAQNNTIYQIGSEAYLNGGGGTLVITCDTNLFFGVGAAPSTCTNSINLDPLFVSIPNRDFHLLVGSPAIDKALTPPCPATDKDGIVRPQGAACDLGAYEFH